jgi:hypothetical protein
MLYLKNKKILKKSLAGVVYLKVISEFSINILKLSLTTVITVCLERMPIKKININIFNNKV